MRMMSERIVGAKEEAADAKLCSRVRTSPCGYRAEDRWIGRSSSRIDYRSEEHTSELQSRPHLVWRLLLVKKIRMARRNPVRVGVQAMRGLAAEVLDWSGSDCVVFNHGAQVQAHGTEGLSALRAVERAHIK